MTATPTENDFGKFGRQFRKAGLTFGLDLAGLFDDEEGQPTEGFEGFAPTFRVESQLKGRSPSTLTYKAPQTPSRTAVFELAPKPSALPGESAPQAPQAQKEQVKEPVKEKANRLLSSFISEGYGPGAIGAMGVGKAQEYGYSNQDILGKARVEGLKFGEQAARGLGINTDLGSYRSGDATPGALGLTAVESMRSQGLADEAIKGLAQQQGLKFGPSAASSLGVSSNQVYQPPAAPSPSISSYASSSSGGGTEGYIGLAGLERAAAAQGISMQEAARRAVSEGTRLGSSAMSLYG
jgi:hypothetical protein